MMEYLIGAAVAWLCRGCLEAYRQRDDLTLGRAVSALLWPLGGGGPPPVIR
jgi:hypothetical protein